MSNAAELSRAILEYVQDSNQQYAIAITGPWGSGKTFFWTQRVTPQLEKTKRQILYVSLYGVSSASEIDKLLLIAQFPVLKFGMFEAFSKLTKSGLDFFNIKLPFDSLKADLRNRVLCFDDLERIGNPENLKQVLGYINGLVEHDKLKVIVICDEHKLDDDYHKIFKEKSVGFTYEFSAEPDHVIDYVIQHYEKTNHAYSKYLTDKRDYLHRIVERSRSENLRALTRGLHCFNPIHRKVVAGSEAAQIFLDRLLALTLSLVFELNKDNSKKLVLGRLFEGVFSTLAIFMGTDESQEKKFLRQYLADYFDSDFGQLATFKSIYSFLTSGIFDEKRFSVELESISCPRDRTNRELFFSEYWKLSDDDFSTTATEVIGLVASNSIRSTKDLITTAQRLFYFSQSGLIERSASELETLFIKSINQQAERHELEYCELDGIGSTIFFNDLTDPAYLAIKMRILELDKFQREAQLTRGISEAFDDLSSNSDAAFAKLFGDEPDKYTSCPIFNHYDPIKLSQAITRLTPDQVLTFRNFIHHRYTRISNIRDFLASDAPALEVLDTQISEYLKKNQTKPLQRHTLGALQKEVENACRILRTGSQAAVE